MTDGKYFILKSDHPRYLLNDHGGGFDSSLRNPYLDQLPKDEKIFVTSGFVPLESLTATYPNIEFYLNVDQKQIIVEDQIKNYKQHPKVKFKNFVCSFNGAGHVSRKLLVSALHQRGWFNSNYASKNFSFTVDELDGHIKDYVGDNDCFYQKFFINHDSHKFSETVNTFDYLKNNVSTNITTVENFLTQSFLNVVSESIGTTYYPFVTEKFSFSIATRGLFLTYGQPGWHQQLSDCFGFKLYTKLFDYKFDTVENPVVRLIEMLSMISKFSNLSVSDWHDLYQLEFDSIEYNYDHLYSGNWIKNLAQYKEKL